ncbi:MAG: stage III sporulation protein AF [Eubacteriales bacterium]
MEEIKSYVYMLVCILAASGLAINLSPEGEMKKYIRYICLLCTAAAICIPGVKIIGGLSGYVADIKSGAVYETGGQADAEKILIEQTRQNIASSVRNYLCEKYGYEKDSVCVEVLLDESDISAVEIKKLTVTLPSDAKAEKIKADLEEMFLGKTEIAVERRG